MVEKRQYVLEVQRFHPRGHIEHPEWHSKFEHIGYLNKLFESAEEASAYYDRCHPHMRRLNAHGTWASDHDPDTGLRYIVREWCGEYCMIDSFTEH